MLGGIHNCVADASLLDLIDIYLSLMLFAIFLNSRPFDPSTEQIFGTADDVACELPIVPNIGGNQAAASL